VVILKNDDKIKKAIALEYNVGADAPRIVAAGKGVVAEKIIETAKENDVPVSKDQKLAESLIKLGIGDQIPPELYEAVAKILAFVCDVDKFVGERKR
jgi:flagellar biosynthesis protein